MINANGIRHRVLRHRVQIGLAIGKAIGRGGMPWRGAVGRANRDLDLIREEWLVQIVIQGPKVGGATNVGADEGWADEGGGVRDPGRLPLAEGGSGTRGGWGVVHFLQRVSLHRIR